MNIISKFLNGEKDSYHYRLVLDIGTEYLKAIVIEYNETERSILGFGKVKQEYGNMSGGAVTDIQAVVARAKQAINQASQSTPHQIEDMVAGIAGEYVKGITLSVEKERSNPNKQITYREIEDLVREAGSTAYQRAVEKVAQETGVDNVKLELIESSIVEIKVDGYKVNNPYQFQGKNLKLITFNSFAPLVHIGSLRTIARESGYYLTQVIADPLAIAGSVMTEESYELGAVIIDIGGGTTDLALIRNGGVEGTCMFAMGGRAFTMTLANNLNLSLREAEQLKISYSNQEELENFEEVDRLVKNDLQILCQGIELALQELSRGEALPKNLFLCGGGSAVLGLIENLNRRNLQERIPFTKPPRFLLLKADEITGIKDMTGLLKNIEHTTPRSLSLQGAKLEARQRGLKRIGNQGL